MANRYLLPVYKYLYNEEFLYTTFDNRLKMQKAIYLLQEMGVPVSDYGFSWYKHGPYSQALLDDAHVASKKHSVSDLSSLSSDNIKALELLRDMLVVPEGSKYTLANWSESLASLLFLKKNVLPRSSSDSVVLDELEKKKSHLKERETNNEALSRIKTIFA